MELVAPQQLAGQKLDAGLNLMYYGSRYYDTYLQRFLQPDSLMPDWYNPQYLNRYSYVRNNPLRYTDPTGHMEVCDDETCGVAGSGNPSSGTNPSSGNTPAQTNGNQGPAGSTGGNQNPSQGGNQSATSWAPGDAPTRAQCSSGWSEQCDLLYGGAIEVDCEIWSCPVGNPVDYSIGVFLLFGPGGPSKELINVSEKGIIRYTEKDLEHVVVRHFDDILEKWAGRSKFLPHEDSIQLLRAAEGVVAQQADNALEGF